MYAIDRLDAQILVALDERPTISTVELAAALHVARNTVHARLKRLRDEDVLGSPSQFVEPASIGHPVLAFVALSVRQQDVAKLYDALASIPEVIEAHTTTGSADLTVRVVAVDASDLHRVTQSIQALPGVQRSNTSIATTDVIRYRTAPLLRRIAAGG